jgi:hypothetical protein
MSTLLPEDPTSFDGLARASMVRTPPNWGAYQRDGLSEEARDAWDARVKGLGGEIVTKTMESKRLRPGRRVAARATVSYYLVPELAD